MFSKKLGVCFSTGDPGTFNLFSDLAVAYSDSIPMLSISGYPSRCTRGKVRSTKSADFPERLILKRCFPRRVKINILEDAKPKINRCSWSVWLHSQEAKDIPEKLINTWQIPFVSTMDAKGYISEDNPLSLGIVGTSGDVGANDYFHESKMIIAAAVRSRKRQFRINRKLMDGKTLLHINIDRRNQQSLYRRLQLISDARPAPESLVAYLEK